MLNCFNRLGIFALVITAFNFCLSQSLCIDNEELKIDETLLKNIILANVESVDFAQGQTMKYVKPVLFNGSEEYLEDYINFGKSNEAKSIDDFANLIEARATCGQFEFMPFSPLSFHLLELENLIDLRIKNETEIVHNFIVTLRDEGALQLFDGMKIDQLGEKIFRITLSDFNHNNELFRSLLQNQQISYIMEDHLLTIDDPGFSSVVFPPLPPLIFPELPVSVLPRVARFSGEIFPAPGDSFNIIDESLILLETQEDLENLLDYTDTSIPPTVLQAPGTFTHNRNPKPSFEEFIDSNIDADLDGVPDLSGEGVKVVLIDTGVFESDAEDIPSIEVSKRYCFSTSTSITQNDSIVTAAICEDEEEVNNCDYSCAHGTMVARLVKGTEDFPGVAPKAEVISVQVASQKMIKLGEDEMVEDDMVIWASDVIRSLDFINTLDLGDSVIINMSLGLPEDLQINNNPQLYTSSCAEAFGETIHSTHSNPLFKSLKPLWQKEYYIVSASGNNGIGTDFGLNSTSDIFAPGALDNIKSPGAVSWPGCANDERILTIGSFASGANEHVGIVDMEAPARKFDRQNDLIVKWACVPPSRGAKSKIEKDSAGCGRGTSWSTALISGAMAACLSGNLAPVLGNLTPDIVGLDEQSSQVQFNPQIPNAFTLDNLCNTFENED